MKFAIMLGATLFGILLGFVPGITRSRPVWWRWIAILSVTATVVLGLYPPIAGTVTDAVMAARMDSTKVVPVLVVRQMDPSNDSSLTVVDARDPRVVIHVDASEDVAAAIDATDAPFILDLQRSGSDLRFMARKMGPVDPAITLPYIMGLEERARIIFFHVPMSWVATIAYLLSMIFAVRYLRSRDLNHDTISMATASVGTLYAVLATVTGAVWAKFNWGSFWNWDPRETSIFLLLLVYAAYFLLRSSIEEPQRRARLSAAYSIVAFVTVPFLIFVLPRLLPGLHPGSSDDVNAGPLLSPKSDAINTTKQVVFGLSLFAFTVVFFWLVNLKVRLVGLTDRINDNEVRS